MITLTKIDNSPITVNADEIEIVETFHDTTVSLKSGKKLIVQESADDIIAKVIFYRQLCYSSYLNQPDIKSVNSL
ncbi:MAG: flagellar FlbD family protein [Ignavibacteriae bacterium]|nr:flagellar FlbD family protein [Ignavibacteriota bacterium]